jgi:hypothetical protein
VNPLPTAEKDLDYPDHVAALRAVDASLADEVASFTGISAVLAWMQKRALTQAKIDIVGQDEFHYDFMIELAPGAAQPRWLVFGVT